MNTASEDIRFALINGTTYRVVRNALDSRVVAVQIEGLKREYCDVSLDELIAHQAIWLTENMPEIASSEPSGSEVHHGRGR